MQSRLVRELYAEAGVDPLSLAFVELHGTGTPTGDPVETNWAADVFCRSGSRRRDGALSIGSTKSNAGHCELASGVVALSKIAIAAQTGVIPGNLHYRIPNPNIPGLVDGRLQVGVTESCARSDACFSERGAAMAPFNRASVQ